MKTYQSIIAALDAHSMHTAWNNKPVRKLNCVVTVSVTTERKTYTKTIYRPTKEAAEKAARSAHGDIIAMILQHNDATIKRAERYGYDVDNEDLEHVKSTSINAIDRDNNTWSINL